MPSALHFATEQAAMSLDLARRILSARRYAESRATTADRLTLAAGTRRDAQRHRWVAARIAEGADPQRAEAASWQAVPGAAPRLHAVLFLAG